MEIINFSLEFFLHAINCTHSFDILARIWACWLQSRCVNDSKETLLADLAYRSDNTLTSDLSKFIFSLILVNFLSISAGSI